MQIVRIIDVWLAGVTVLYTTARKNEVNQKGSEMVIWPWPQAQKGKRVKCRLSMLLFSKYLNSFLKATH